MHVCFLVVVERNGACGRVVEKFSLQYKHNITCTPHSPNLLLHFQSLCLGSPRDLQALHNTSGKEGIGSSKARQGWTNLYCYLEFRRPRLTFKVLTVIVYPHTHVRVSLSGVDLGWSWVELDWARFVLVCVRLSKAGSTLRSGSGVPMTKKSVSYILSSWTHRRLAASHTIGIPLETWSINVNMELSGPKRTVAG